MWEIPGRRAYFQVGAIWPRRKEQSGESRNKLYWILQKLLAISTQYFYRLKVLLIRIFFTINSKMTYIEIVPFSSDLSSRYGQICSPKEEIKAILYIWDIFLRKILCHFYISINNLLNAFQHLSVLVLIYEWNCQSWTRLRSDYEKHKLIFSVRHWLYSEILLQEKRKALW